MLLENSKIPTENFSVWLENVRRYLAADEGSQVPCGDCRGCCSSSYFILIKADEIQPLSVIPEALLFPAPLLPEGNYVMGFDQNGNCPMFRENKCSIYSHRPKSCRKYDCRLLAAAGLQETEDKTVINQRVSQWEFAFETSQDRENYNAVQRAASFMLNNMKDLPEGFVPEYSIQQAILAVKVYEVFLNSVGDFKEADQVSDKKKIIDAVIDKYEKFNN